MSETPSINPARAHSARSIARAASDAESAPERLNGAASARPGDQIDISSHAVLLSRLRSLPALREDLVQQVRAQIEDGSYETAEKVEAAVAALADELADTE